ncbi:MAG: GNAT family N-acetyltransferase [Promethearchaeia archaeon]
MGTDKRSQINTYSPQGKDDSYQVRRCTIDDLEGVIEVNEQELPEDYPYFFYKSILEKYSDAFLVACPKDDLENIMGYVMWRVERAPSVSSLRLIKKGHLVSIAVLEKYRRQGIASSLLAKSMPAISKFNIKEFVLEVRISNYEAINLYEKFKYRTAKVKENYYRDGEDAYFMVRKV